MSGHEKVCSCVASVVPCAHMAWPKGKAPALPWAVYYADRSAPVGEDGLYAEAVEWFVELYQRSRDAKVEGALEKALRSEFGAIAKEESWVSEESCLMTVYMFTDYQEVNDGEEE